jgi:hypothetical protein
MEEAESLREKAKRCVRLGRAIDTQDVIAKLLELSQEFEAKARSIEVSFAARKRKDESSN